MGAWERGYYRALAHSTIAPGDIPTLGQAEGGGLGAA